MKIKETSLAGAFILSIDPHHDDRGFFARIFCKKEFSEKGLEDHFVQCNISANHKKGTLRGLHYQVYPHEEVKVVWCRQGAIYDVIVDIRQYSPTYGQWLGVELSAANNQLLYIPKGFAHGFQTLCNNVEVFYWMGEYYHPQAARGICWSDPSLAIQWPLEEIILSEQDRSLPNFMWGKKFLEKR